MKLLVGVGALALTLTTPAAAQSLFKKKEAAPPAPPAVEQPALTPPAPAPVPAPAEPVPQAPVPTPVEAPKAEEPKTVAPAPTPVATPPAPPVEAPKPEKAKEEKPKVQEAKPAAAPKPTTPKPEKPVQQAAPKPAPAPTPAPVPAAAPARPALADPRPHADRVEAECIAADQSYARLCRNWAAAMRAGKDPSLMLTTAGVLPQPEAGDVLLYGGEKKILVVRFTGSTVVFLDLAYPPPASGFAPGKWGAMRVQ